MPSIKAVQSAVPPQAFSTEDIMRIGDTWLKDVPSTKALFERFLSASATKNRHFAISSEELLNLKGMEQRTKLFERFGPELGEAALNKALTISNLKAEDLKTIVFTSCSCPSIPAIDALIIERAGLSRSISRVPIYQHGCAGGIIGLELAADLARVRGPVALTSVELCSLVFQPENHAPAQLVGAAIFADGAACAIVVPEDTGLVIVGYSSFLVPESKHLMGYDIFDDGFHLRLDRELPQALVEVVPERVRKFLAEHKLVPEQISAWLFHPGGVKILDFLEEIFNLEPKQCRWSRDILRTVGNVSSATVLFVLKAFLESKFAKHGDKVLMIGVGPGLTIELMLFEWTE